MARARNIAPNRHAVHPFDLQYRTDTGGYLRPDELGDTNCDGTNNGYSAVAPSVFRNACRLWRETLPVQESRLQAYTFVDVGAGKGRALLLAAELPFRKIIGVESNQGLASIAQRNVAIWSRDARLQARIRVRHQDAMEFEWPHSPLLVYLNNPFEYELVGQLASHLVTASVRHCLIDILYVNPAWIDALTCRGCFKIIRDQQIEMNEADQKADPYGAFADRVAILRLCRVG